MALLVISDFRNKDIYISYYYIFNNEHKNNPFRICQHVTLSTTGTAIILEGVGVLTLLRACHVQQLNIELFGSPVQFTIKKHKTQQKDIKDNDKM